MKVVQQLTGLTLGRPSSLFYLTGELLNTPVVRTTTNTIRDGSNTNIFIIGIVPSLAGTI